MAELFQCPTCSGRLQYDGGDHATVRCEYCGNTVIVPDSLRSRKQGVADLYGQQGAMHEVVRLINAGERSAAAQVFAQAFNVDEARAQEAVARLADGLSLSSNHVSVQMGDGGNGGGALRRTGCILFTAIMLVVVVTAVAPLVVGGFTIWSVFSQEPAEVDGGGTGVIEMNGVATTVAEVTGEENPIELVGAESAADYATLLDSFGSEGIAQGQFVDPRALAVAPDGQFYIADYSNGRVQRFGGDGSAQGVWQWDEDRVIQALSVGTQQDLYAIQGGALVRFSRESGEPLGELTYTSDRPVSFRDVAVAPDGDIVALNHFGEFVRFDSAGNVRHTVNIEEAAEVLSADKLALDGRGNVYLLAAYEDVLGKRQHGVFLFNNEGRYLTRFGSDGDEPGQFTSPSAIAVDGQGRIYISDFPGIMTFSNSGNYLGVTDTEGFVFGIAFNGQGEMLAVSNANKLFRYQTPAAP